MKIIINAFEDGAPIPAKYALCVPGENGPVDMAPNINPEISWEDVPEGTKSFAITIIDIDVPSKPDDVNQEGKTVPKDLPRVDFFHLTLCNIPVDINMIPEGALSDGVTARGKKSGQIEYGFAGLNDYTGWFKGDENMEGDYGSYDGPCPPWNDSIPHRYIFKVYALDIEEIDLNEKYTGQELIEAMDGHIIDTDEKMCTYLLNKELL